jgi:hypothetical protein
VSGDLRTGIRIGLFLCEDVLMPQRFPSHSILKMAKSSFPSFLGRVTIIKIR